MSNPQHPQFFAATPTELELGVLQESAPTSGASTPRGGGADARSVGLGLTTVGLWALLFAELASKFSAPGIL